MTSGGGTEPQGGTVARPPVHRIAWTVIRVLSSVAALVVLGLAVKVIVGAVQRSRQRRTGPPGTGREDGQP
ncbi:hypothetical protein [Kitasatospora terrestris]|uniref:hypothetical protein n=1 Tax=Kitasatospora terrestris TaxID=258051 RepID=UPI0031E9E175